MTCAAEEQALARIRQRRAEAEQREQLERTGAELELRSEKRIYDWGTQRLAAARLGCWEQRHAQAEEALKRCKEKEKRQHTTE